MCISNMDEKEEEGEIRVISLEERNSEEVVYRVEKGTLLQFRLSASLHGHTISLFCNHPSSASDKFAREIYYKIDWVVDKENEETFANLKTTVSGCFQFYFEKNGKKSGCGYFLVDPFLRTGKDNTILTLDSICCQTFFPKCLGPFAEWKDRLEVAYQSGYNMIHFTPVQELGKSNSSYSISNQLALNPIFGNVEFDDVQKIVNDMKDEWGVLSICDVVVNHTANETPWLKTNPESGYNLVNSPHLRPAYLFDCVLALFSQDISNGLYTDRGLPSKINTDDHLNIIRTLLKDELLPKVKIEEMFMVNVDKLVDSFRTLVDSAPRRTENSVQELKIFQDPQYRRLSSTVDFNLAVQMHFWEKHGENDKNGAVESFRNHLNHLNENVFNLIQSHLNAGVENVIAGVRYERLQHDGPKLPEVTEKDPLIHRYFQNVLLLGEECQTIAEEEKLLQTDDSRFILAHNGWVMSDNPLQNFAEAGSDIYLRRELIAWGDSVKLRFGPDPSYCPFLWDIMKKYVELTASVFHGLRLDNCHSTPIHLAEFLLDAARNVRPDLFVVAELFTNSDRTDNIFVNRLGITSLIREAMAAGDSHEQGRLVYRYGGIPVGTFVQEPVRPMIPTIAHALMMDQTHDNPSPITKRSVYDVLPTAAMVAMAGCASGSNRGLDELVPHHIHVVDETRFYSSWSDTKSKKGLVNMNTGIISAKKVINNLHTVLGQEGFTEVYVDQMDYDIVAVTRNHPITHGRIVLVAYTAFSYPDSHFHRSGEIKDLVFEGVLENVLFESVLKPTDLTRGNFPTPTGFEKDPNFINAVDGYECIVKENFSVEQSNFVKLEGNAIKFVNFQPGSVIAFRINPPTAVTEAVSSLRNLISKENLKQIIEPLTFNDLNTVLYKCEEEEKDFSGFGSYNIPNFGTFVYAGLQGIHSSMTDIRLRNDTGHPICNNLRAGDWLMEYTFSRLLKNEGTKELGQLLQKCTDCIRQIPRYLVPSYFDLIIRNVYLCCIDEAWNKMSNFIQDGSPFGRALALGSVQCCGLSISGPLPSLSPNLEGPKPTVKVVNGKEVVDCGSLCAGLPHFSTGYMRNWGRDTFISLPGLLIITGRYSDARNHILAFASTLRHGLIPNLLDRGTNSRYNCRDATWFWLQAIKIYIENVPSGETILKDRVSRMWPNDFGDAVLDHSVEQSLEDVMHEALQRHFEGIHFREKNAGNRIDGHMTDNGFNVVAAVNLETGFVYGGNTWNCGTWMDKMGSSDKASVRGVPATPRDGSAVELVGLSASVVKFLSEMNSVGKYKYNSVQKTNSDGKTVTWTLSEWNATIQKNFEDKFWIPDNPDQKHLDPHPELINRVGIYKDSFGASSRYCDYQFRPNFLVAMTVAPHLFSSNNAITAINKAQSILLSELGMRTLDPSDWNYNGNYDNSNDSSDSKVAHGFNYHNGPEWLWPVGFYLRAYLKFFTLVDKKSEAIRHTRQVISKHWNYIQSSQWKGLPELTNKDGAECWGSCTVQAWSMATILELLKDLADLENTN